MIETCTWLFIGMAMGSLGYSLAKGGSVIDYGIPFGLLFGAVVLHYIKVGG